MDKILRLGLRMEMAKMVSKEQSDTEPDRYSSSIHEIIDDEYVLITNPCFKARLIPLHPQECYDCYLFSGGKIYHCRMVVVNSQIDGNIRVVKMQIVSAIEKYERRKYFRLDINMKIRYLRITAENTGEFKKAVVSNTILKMDGFVEGTTINISGGGVKFNSAEPLHENDMIMTHLTTEIDGQTLQYLFMGKVIESQQNPNIRNNYIHRINFINVSPAAREGFVQFIFRKQREQLKLKGNR